MECYSRHFTTSSLYSPTNIFRDWFNEKWPTSPLLPFVGLDDDGSNFFGYSEDSLSPSPLLSSSSPSISDVGTPTMCPNWSCLDTPQNVDAKPPAFPIEFPHFSPTGHIIDHAALKAAQHEVYSGESFIPQIARTFFDDITTGLYTFHDQDKPGERDDRPFYAVSPNLFPQLDGRASSVTDSIHSTISPLVEALTLEYPFDTINPAGIDQDDEGISGSEGVDDDDDEYLPNSHNSRKRRKSTAPRPCKPKRVKETPRVQPSDQVHKSASKAAQPPARATNNARRSKRPRLCHPSSRTRSKSEPIPPWGCPICEHVQHNKRLPDLRRHIQAHERQLRAPEWVCCGVPVELAEIYGVPSDSPVTIWKDKRVVGGCYHEFSRRDAFKRHLASKNGICAGDMANYSKWFN